MTTINQKEYLKKYLAIGKAPGEKKKKKKKPNAIGNRLKIIDDDNDIISQEIQDDITAANEDAPQIVAVIDERPPSLRIDEETKNKLWKPIGESSEILDVEQSVHLSSSFQLGKQSEKGDDLKYHMISLKRKSNNHISKLKTKRDESCSSKTQSGSDYSPPRKTSKNNSDTPPRRTVESPHRRGTRTNEDSPVRKYNEDYSPPIRKIQDDYSPPRKIRDNSPPRQSKGDFSPSRAKSTGNTSDIDNSPPRKNKDNSPPRRNKGDYSPSRAKSTGNTSDIDNSPPRKRNNREGSFPSGRNESRRSRAHSSKRQDDFSSPEGKRNKDDNSPPRRKFHKEGNFSSNRNGTSQSRGRTSKTKEDFSPPRRKTNEDMSPLWRGIKQEKDHSPPRGNKADDRHRKSRWGEWSSEASPEPPRKSDEKMKKTLDGKKAGLQNAKDLVQENTLLRQREDELFKNMSEDVSGINAKTVVRAKKVRDLEEEAHLQKKQKETKEKYDRWGKGLAQVESHNVKVAEQLHEMSKPLARYADDEDLERYLKEQERDGDPMLAYIRKKKKKESVAAGIPEKPMYMGEFMPNRFAIRPGYRWDGVDRSNGYEKKWFEVQNSKKASQEEAFKWSTEDM